VEQGGLKVYTTLDWDKQQLAEEAVRQGAENNVKKYGAENAALVAMDPKNGQILAMVGSKDYFDKDIDGQVNVTIRDRQPGSSFKPYVYLTAFSKGYTPETQFWDVDTNFSTEDGKTYNPKNYDGKNHGFLQMKDALAMSLNVPAVKTLYLAGVKSAIETAKKLGITTLNEPDRYGLSLVLGGGEVKLLDHVHAFSTLANVGVYQKKTAILRIEDSSGTVLEKFEESEGEKVFEKEPIAMLDYVLSTNSLRAPVFGDNNPLRFDYRPVAAKTGTTNEWRDGWTIGYTPSLAAGVWAGNNDNSVMAEGADGSYVAAPIWRAFMEKALQNYPIDNFPEYNKEKFETGKDILDGKLDDKIEVKVCKISGKKDKYCLANDKCPDSKVDKKKFTNAHSILYYVDRENPKGDRPGNPDKDPQYENWEKAIKKYLEDDNDKKIKTAPDEECREKDF
jgi:membrane peptidoglycan carboxypeptidase